MILRKEMASQYVTSPNDVCSGDLERFRVVKRIHGSKGIKQLRDAIQTDS